MGERTLFIALEKTNTNHGGNNMPLIVDKDSVRNEIILAFQQCLNQKPLAKVSMRDIAEKANIAHSKINYYFTSKHNLIISYVQYIADFYAEIYDNWYDSFLEKGDTSKSPQECIKCFIKDVVLIDHKQHSWAFTQINILGQYDAEIRASIDKTYSVWRSSISNMVKKVYHDKIDNPYEVSESLLILIEGILLYSLNENVNEYKIDLILKHYSEIAQ